MDLDYADSTSIIDEQDDVHPLLEAVSENANLTTTTSKTTVTALVFGIYTLDCLAGYILDVPIVVLLEKVACWSYYSTLGKNDSIDVPENDCKLPAIQREVALIQGLRGTFDAIPAFLTSICYGRMADLHGRKLILVLSWCGLLLHLTWLLSVCYFKNFFPLRTIWLGSFALFLGGGHKIFIQTALCVLADIHESQASITFMIMSAIKALTSAVGYPLSGAFLLKGLWLPFVFAMSVNALCSALVLLMPETLPSKFDHAKTRECTASIQTAHVAASDRFTMGRHLDWLVRKGILEPIVYTRTTAQQLFAVGRSRRLSTVLFLYAVASSNSLLLPQYASQRLDWPLKSVVVLLTARHISAAFVTGMLLPCLRHYSVDKVVEFKRLFFDRRILLCSLGVSAAGYIIAGLCGQQQVAVLFAGVTMLASVEAIEPLCLGLFATETTVEKRGSLFIGIGLLEAVGTICGRTLMTALFSHSVELDGWGRGSCFLLSAMLLAISIIVVQSISG